MSWVESTFGSKISPILLFIIVILAAIFFICGLLHFIIRFLMKQRSARSNHLSNREHSSSGAFQRQLQQLFHLHDSGLDQACIDALPVFLYRDIMGLKEPFDCAVCLCEFSAQDKLRLLPSCSHAFHIDCIDTWLLSNSTCPLCRGVISTPGFSFENPVFNLDESKDEDVNSGNVGVVAAPCGPKNDDNPFISGSRVFSVRLGKFRHTNNSGTIEAGEFGETSNSNLEVRRCYSMGSFQYVVADSEFQVALCPSRDRLQGVDGTDTRFVKGRDGQNGDFTSNRDVSDGKKINIWNKSESFSVSKIWLWPKKGKSPTSADSIF